MADDTSVDAWRSTGYGRNHNQKEPAMSVVLVVDDDAGVREYVGDLLDMEGHDVRFAVNGSEGWSRSGQTVLTAWFST